MGLLPISTANVNSDSVAVCSAYPNDFAYVIEFIPSLRAWALRFELFLFVQALHFERNSHGLYKALNSIPQPHWPGGNSVG